jgi:hypothetical protein
MKRLPLHKRQALCCVFSFRFTLSFLARRRRIPLGGAAYFYSGFASFVAFVEGFYVNVVCRSCRDGHILFSTAKKGCKNAAG